MVQRGGQDQGVNEEALRGHGKRDGELCFRGKVLVRAIASFQIIFQLPLFMSHNGPPACGSQRCESWRHRPILFLALEAKLMERVIGARLPVGGSSELSEGFVGAEESK